MKKPGDRQHVAAKPFEAMIAEMAEQLSSADDPRFKRFWKFEPFPKVKTWFERTTRTNVLVGANKSGKTTTSIMKAICVFTGLVPPAVAKCWPGAAFIPLDRPRRVRIIVQDYSKHWPETIRPLLLDDDAWGMLPKTWAQNYNDTEHIFYGPDGSLLSIMAISPKDTDEVKIAMTLRGPLIDHTYIDELQKRIVFTESLVRSATLRDGPHSVDLGFCPQEGYDWTFEDIYKTGYDSKTDEELPEEVRPADINVMRIGMKDNPSISSEEIDAFVRSLKPHEIAYRVEGKYSARAGDPYFDIDRLTKWKTSGCIRPGVPHIVIQKHCDVEAGEFNGKLVSMPSAVDRTTPVWEVWEKPRAGEYYLMTVDTAEGHKHSDANVCDVWRCSKSGKIDVNHPVQVAQLRIVQMKPGEFIEECLCVATIYGEIMVAYEVNNTSGGTVRDRSRNYPNLYRRRSVKTEIEDDTDLLGWWTDGVAKAAALEECYHMMQNWNVVEDCGLRSVSTCEELMAYQELIERDPKTHASKRVFASLPGVHDDTITTLFIMAYVLRFQHDVLTQTDESVIVGSDENELSPMERKAHESVKRQSYPLPKRPSLNSIARNHATTRRPQAGIRR